MRVNTSDVRSTTSAFAAGLPLRFTEGVVELPGWMMMSG